MSNTAAASENSSTHLRDHWRNERAYRLGRSLMRATFVLTFAAVILNYRFTGAVEIAADVVLLLGCVVSEILTRRREPRRYFVWWPMYLGFLVGTAPSTWLSGGIYSPWLGFYLMVFIIFGHVVQTEIKPLYNTIFVVSQVFVWILVQRYFPYPDHVGYLEHLPPGFMASAACICLIGVGYCIQGLMRTEHELSREIELRYLELYEARASLLREESANQAKSTFLANISHELRTPLGAVLGYANLLQDTASSELEKTHYAETIERNGKQLAKLVDDLLDLSKVEAGRLEIEKLDSRTVELISEVLNLLQISALKKNLRLEVRFAGPVPEVISVDPYRFKQILTNIVGNAVKFTDQGSILITLHYSELSSELFIAVRDTGRGIAPVEREKLFKPFSQADASMARRYGGTGLGLNFSRELVRLLGGEIELTWSELGAGSEFTIRLPVQAAFGSKLVTEFIDPLKGRAAVPPTVAPVEYNFKNLKILVVDDSADNRDLIRRFLHPTGADVDEANDGMECLQKVTTSAYDVVLMDIQMPGLDGLQATSLLRKKGNHFPIIAITAHAMKEDRDRCLQAGCNHHIAKPIKRGELMQAIQSAAATVSQLSL